MFDCLDKLRYMVKPSDQQNGTGDNSSDFSKTSNALSKVQKQDTKSKLNLISSTPLHK